MLHTQSISGLTVRTDIAFPELQALKNGGERDGNNDQPPVTVEFGTVPEELKACRRMSSVG